MATKKKVLALFKLMSIFLQKREIATDDAYVLNILECSPRTLERYLKDLHKIYGHILTIKKVRKKYYKLVSISNILEEFIKHSDDISELLQMAREFDPEIFKELEKSTLKKLTNRDDSVFVFKNYTMESLINPKVKEHFNYLKYAIRMQKTLDISSQVSNDKEFFYGVKPLRLIFTNNNWYIAIIYNNKVKLIQLNFITEINKSNHKFEITYKDLDTYLNFLKRLQNALTLYGEPIKVAKIKATVNISHYFKKDMKKLLPSQKFIKECEDGSIIFTLNYTQDLEILPLIQKWLPDLVILSPKELQVAYIQKLQNTLSKQVKELL